MVIATHEALQYKLTIYENIIIFFRRLPTHYYNKQIA